MTAYLNDIELARVADAYFNAAAMKNPNEKNRPYEKHTGMIPCFKDTRLYSGGFDGTGMPAAGVAAGIQSVWSVKIWVSPLLTF